MNDFHFIANTALGPASGIACEVLLGVALLALVYYVKVRLVRNTKDFVIANRKIGFGFGVAGLISIWTWAMAVMMSAAQTYSFGLSGLFWFTVPNGLAVIAAIPFVRKIRDLMPEGYTIPEFVQGAFRRQQTGERRGGAWRAVRLADRGHHQHQGHLARCLQCVRRRSAACRDHRPRGGADLFDARRPLGVRHDVRPLDASAHRARRPLFSSRPCTTPAASMRSGIRSRRRATAF